jgi:hypothetical protein
VSQADGQLLPGRPRVVVAGSEAVALTSEMSLSEDSRVFTSFETRFAGDKPVLGVEPG